MEQFITEHGGIIVSGIVSVIALMIIFGVIAAAGNMDVYALSAIMGG
jgi:hypothetical protein